MTADSENPNQLRPNWLTEPRPERFNAENPSFEQSMTAHGAAVAAEQLGYIDPTTGLFVMTAAYLQSRGWCCDRGCRHCPFEPFKHERKKGNGEPA